MIKLLRLAFKRNHRDEVAPSQHRFPGGEGEKSFFSVEVAREICDPGAQEDAGCRGDSKQ
jgi:hypothetical protein